jgi:hypothetical protein
MAAQSESPVLGFVVGMSRAGTTWMARALGSHLDVVAFGETQYWGKKYRSPEGDVYARDEVQHIIEEIPGSILSQEEGTSLQKILEDRAVSNLAERASPKALFDRISRAAAAQEGKSSAVEKTPHHVNHLDQIAEAYPEARFIVMARAPYDFMLSYKHQGDRKPKAVRQEFKSLYHPIGCALVYRGYAQSIQSALRQYPDRTLLVTLDEVKSDAGSALATAQRFLGIEPSAPVPPPSNSSFPGERSPSLAPEDLFWMNAMAAREIQTLGYETRGSSISLSSAVRSLARVPPWALRAFSKLWSQSPNPVRYAAQWLFPGR